VSRRLRVWRRVRAVGSVCVAIAFGGCDDRRAGTDGGAERSLCTPARDPERWLCGAHKPPWLNSLDALALARAHVHADAQLIRVDSDILNFDGEALDWTFVYVNRKTGERTSLAVRSRQVSVSTAAGDPNCDGPAEIHALPSRSVVHDTVHRIEARARFGLKLSDVTLYLSQSGCPPEYLPEDHHILVKHQLPSDGGDAGNSIFFDFYFARYWDDGRFIELVGPCSADLELCLIGPSQL
jgi:hypothetical protein